MAKDWILDPAGSSMPRGVPVPGVVESDSTFLERPGAWIVTTSNASMAQTPAEPVPSSIKTEKNLRPALFLNNAKLTASSTPFSPRVSSFVGTTNHDTAFLYDESGDVLHDDAGRSFTYDALSMTTGATAPLSNGGTRTFAYIYTADYERIALVEKLSSGATTTNWTLRGLDNHLLRTWTNNSTTGWSWREDDIWRGAALLAYESPTGVRHYGLDHLGSPAILTDALAHPIGNITFDAFGNGGRWKRDSTRRGWSDQLKPHRASRHRRRDTSF